MIKFKYKKANGEVSDRVGIVMSSPIKNYSILDLTNASAEERTEVLKAAEAFFAEKKQVLDALEVKYRMDEYVSRYFKHFKPEGLSDWEVCDE